MTPTPRFYKASEIAAILQISRALAYQLIATGQLSAVRFGRTVRVRQEDLDRFIQTSSTEQSTDLPVIAPPNLLVDPSNPPGGNPCRGGLE